MSIHTPPWAGPSLRRGAVAIVLAFAAACGGSSTTMTSPTAPATSDTFTGTLAVGGIGEHTFTVAEAGAVTVTLASVSPQSTITVGLGIGQLSGTTCTLFADDETARMGSVEQGTVAAGSYCVEIYDLGNVQASDTYMITVQHT
jgi:hypothetical protein